MPTPEHVVLLWDGQQFEVWLDVDGSSAFHVSKPTALCIGGGDSLRAVKRDTAALLAGVLAHLLTLDESDAQDVP